MITFYLFRIIFLALILVSVGWVDICQNVFTGVVFKEYIQSPNSLTIGWNFAINRHESRQNSRHVYWQNLCFLSPCRFSWFEDLLNFWDMVPPRRGLQRILRRLAWLANSWMNKVPSFADQVCPWLSSDPGSFWQYEGDRYYFIIQLYLKKWVLPKENFLEVWHSNVRILYHRLSLKSFLNFDL